MILQISQLGTLPILPCLLAACVSWVAYYIWRRLCSYQGAPKTLPWVGVRKGDPIERARATLKSLLGLRELLLEGYSKYSKQGQSFILPNLINGLEVVLPVKHMPWLIEQPERILSQHETNRQFMCSDYTMLDVTTLGGWHRIDERVKREITQGIDDFADGIIDETLASLDNLFGTDHNKWHEVNLYPTMVEAVGRVVGRVFVGKPLCSNPGYLQSSTSWSRMILFPAMIIELIPSFFRPLIGPVVTAWDKLQYRRMRSYTLPLLRERVNRLRHLETCEKPSPAADAAEPNDFIQWSIRDALLKNENPLHPNEQILKRLTVTTFAAVQSSAITLTNVLVGIAAHRDSLDIQSQLREEALSAAGNFSRASLAQLPKLDSILTETLRMWVIVTHGVTKTVVAKDGVTLPTGEHLPRGAKVGIASYGPHFDEEVYGTEEASPFEYDPWRFTREEMEKRVKKEGQARGTAFVATGPYYLGFSHGRGACPGRHFANSLLKIMLAEVVMRYDIEPIEERPQNPWLNNTIGPPVGTKLRVRRRVEGNAS